MHSGVSLWQYIVAGCIQRCHSGIRYYIGGVTPQYLVFSQIVLLLHVQNKGKHSPQSELLQDFDVGRYVSVPGCATIAVKYCTF